MLRLEYEAYEPMAAVQMRRLCAHVRATWSVQHLALVHRLGWASYGVRAW